MNPLNQYMDLPPAEIPFSTLHVAELEPIALFGGLEESRQGAIREMARRLHARAEQARAAAAIGGRRPKGITSSVNGLKGGRPRKSKG